MRLVYHFAVGPLPNLVGSFRFRFASSSASKRECAILTSATKAGAIDGVQFDGDVMKFHHAVFVDKQGFLKQQEEPEKTLGPTVSNYFQVATDLYEHTPEKVCPHLCAVEASSTALPKVKSPTCR